MVTPPPQQCLSAVTPEAAQARSDRAEDLARENLTQIPKRLDALSPARMQQLMHELQVHQVELEMQNEELRLVQSELEVSRAHYFDLYDLAPVGYLTVSDSGLILLANLSASRLLGLPRNKLVKRLFSHFIVKTQQDVYYQCRTQLLKTGLDQACELALLQDDGTELWVNIHISMAPAGADAPVFRVTLSDISERKRLDQALYATNLELTNARLAAEKANLAKSEFLSNMSHDLRSPLNAILGFAQLIQSGVPPPTPSQQASIEQILHGGWYLLSLINEILDLALIESGRLSLSMQSVTLPEVLNACEAMIEPQAQASGIQVIFPQADCHCRVQADPTRLKQVLVNLLTNAIKYNRVGGTVEVVCCETATGRTRISVQDSGAGLAPDQLAQLFQPFNRIGQERGMQEGTGIGLVVCKRLVEMMDGEIGVQSEVGVGSVFWFELNPPQAVPAESHN